MSLANCKECNGLFVRVNRDICDNCFKEQEKILLQVQRYIKEHPQQTLSEVAEANEIDESLVLKFIHEKRLLMSSSSSDNLPSCESCGARIASGRLCVMCRAQLGAGLESAANNAQEPAASGKVKVVSGGRREARGDSMIKGKFQRR